MVLDQTKEIFERKFIESVPISWLILVKGQEPRERDLGFVVIRGTQVSMLSPAEGIQEISNPFFGQE